MFQRPAAKSEPPAVQVQTEEEPPEITGVKNMGNKVLVEVTSDLPPAQASWKVDVGDDIKLSLAITNIYYDVIAAASAKIGVEI